jgi:hypothetical protein
LHGAKPRAFPGGLTAAERQKYQSQRGVVFPKQKEKPVPFKLTRARAITSSKTDRPIMRVTKEGLFERANQLGKKFPYTQRGSMRTEKSEENFLKQRKEMTFFILSGVMKEMGLSTKSKKEIHRALTQAYQQSRLNGDFRAALKALQAQAQPLKAITKDVPPEDWERMITIFGRVSLEIDSDPHFSQRLYQPTFHTTYYACATLRAFLAIIREPMK